MMRVRFAPSPTGKLHIGNARTALFNWLYARRFGGKFILRIEDTDVERSTEESAQGILEDLKWLGILWDEGSDVGGEYGPYKQSQRSAVYKEHLDKLLKEGKAYYCYCQADELEKRRQEALAKGETPRYDNRCRDLSPQQLEEFKRQGIAPVVRFKVPETTVEFDDLVRGHVSFDTKLFGDFVLTRSGGGPMFNFTVVVDDCLMKITHVIRGEDHLPNTPKHILLFKALGYEPPQFAHLAMILAGEGEKLSKRDASMSVGAYRQKGYLPEALVNYIALLGWAPSENKEIMPAEQMIKEFDIKNVSKSAARFDLEKLNWMDADYIKRADIEKITRLCVPYFEEKGLIGKEISDEKFKWLCKVVDAVKEHLVCLSQVTDFVDIFFKDTVGFDDQQARSLIKEQRSRIVITSVLEALKKIDGLNDDTMKSLMKDAQKAAGIKGADFYKPLRAAVTGTSSGPELVKVLPIFGKDKCIRNLNEALKIAG